MILVTGGLGYIGSHVNKQLNKRGYETLVVDNLVHGHKEFAKWGKFEHCDLSDLERLRKIFQEYPIQAVLHFAAFAYVGESMSNPQKYYFNNVVNSINLLNAMRKVDVNTFIYSSSCTVYGVPETNPIVESFQTSPINTLGRTKITVEKILEDYDRAYGFKSVALRYFNASGADPDCEIGEWHEPETHIIPLTLDVALGKKEFVEIYGTDYSTFDGTCIRDYIHVDDLAEAHILALEHLLNNGKSDVFNLGNENGYSVNQLIDMARSVTGNSIKSKHSPRRPGDPPDLRASSEKIQKILDWKPKFNSLEVILSTAWEWHKKLYNSYK